MRQKREDEAEVVDKDEPPVATSTDDELISKSDEREEVAKSRDDGSLADGVLTGGAPSHETPPDDAPTPASSNVDSPLNDKNTVLCVPSLLDEDDRRENDEDASTGANAEPITKNKEHLDDDRETHDRTPSYRDKTSRDDSVSPSSSSREYASSWLAPSKTLDAGDKERTTKSGSFSSAASRRRGDSSTY